MDQIKFSEQTGFYEQIKEGPIFLLLGQNYLCLESGNDPFLSIALRKFACPSSEPQQYEQLLHGKAHEDTESALRWMEQRCAHLPIPEWLTIVAKLSWNAIYTSAIDVIWLRTFDSEWRTTQAVVDEKYNPPNPRDPATLHCTFLFGSISRSEELERPPLTPRELRSRNMIATRLISRLPNTITPFGTLVIEGYAGSLDWLKLEVLTAIIDDLNARPTHIFSVKGTLAEELQHNEDISALVKEGKLVLHIESLAAYLLEGISQGRLKPDESMPAVAEGRRISLENSYLTVPADLWRQVTKSATILDDTIMLSEPSYSLEKEYADFRAFIAGTNRKTIWTGYKRKFAFTRDYESNLYFKVNQLLKLKKTPPSPIMVHGQTGTGKTVALSALAYKIREEKKYPVLFIEQRTRGDANFPAIERFCRWAQENGAPICLVVWDGMGDIELYSDLLKFLAGKGPEAVVVGSCYRLKYSIKRKAPYDQIFEAPDRLLEETELPRFREFLKKFNVALSQKERPDDTFLVTLYHLLPQAHPRIRTGLLDEFNAEEQRLRQSSQENKADPFFGTVLEYKLYKSGWIALENLKLSDSKIEFSREEISEIQKLVALVMVPGSLGLKVPLGLLLHTLSKHGQLNFIDILSKSDIFQCVPDDQGNYIIGPRHSLEAQIFMLNRVGGPSYEIGYMQVLLAEIDDNGEISNNPEVQFAINLLYRVKPNEQTFGTESRFNVGKRYVRYFRDLAETLGKLRTERSISNPRLMLQEATLLREYVIDQYRRNKANTEVEDVDFFLEEEVDLSGDDEALEALLDKAEDIINEALEQIEEDRQNAKFRSRLLVELAAILGTKMTTLLTRNDTPDLALDLYQSVRKEIQLACALDKENFYPIDVFSWVTKTLLNPNNMLSEQERLEAEADILHLFEMTDPEDFDFYQQERFDKRRMEIGELLNRHELTQEAFESLCERGSSAGYYLTAYSMAGYQPGDLTNVVLEPDRLELCCQAADYLEQHRQAIKDDGKCLYLLLRLWWMSRTGFPMFSDEPRLTLPFSQDEWHYCLKLLNDLKKTGDGDAYNTPSINYLRGLATFHLDRTDEAFDIFKQVEQGAETMQGQARIRNNYLASTSTGQSIVYSGTIRWLDKNWGKSTVFVEGLRRIISFYPHDFANQEIRQGGRLSFNIAFNFLGPKATSIVRNKLRPERTNGQG